MATLPMKCRAYLRDRCLDFEEIEENGQKGVVLKRFLLTPGRFDSEKADILILLPAGYPDVAPDMFYAVPWLRLAGTNQYPRAADQPVAFVGLTWQRWSRHSNAWRLGIDGIWTMVKRIEAALSEAA
jgi:hypothetical protein